MKALIIFILLSTVLLSCIESVAPLTSHQPTLVIQSYISPQDTSIVVQVGQTTPFIAINSKATGLLNPGDVTVTLTAVGGSSVTLASQSRSRADSLYGWVRFAVSTKKFLIETGKLYQLRVVHTRLGVAEGSCTVPASRVSRSEVNISINKSTVQPGIQHTLSANWGSTNPAPNYYSFTAYSSIELADPKATPRYINASNNVFYLTESDKVNGVFDISTLISIPGTEKAYTSQSFIIVSICTTDENYYRYNMNIIRQRQEQTANQIPEPVAVTGNMRGALGVFGAYTITNILTKL